MKNKLKDFFNYSSSERKGTIILIVILLFVYSGYWLKDFLVTPSSFEMANLSEEVSEFINSENNESENSMPIKYFEFNPNEIDKESWVRLGFSEKQALSIIKYREKGGYFYKKEDLKRLYVVNDSTYKLLEPYLVLSSTSKPKSKYAINKCYFVKLIEDTVPVYNGFSGFEKVVCNKKNGVYAYYVGGFSSKEVAKGKQLKIDSSGFPNTEVVSLSCNFGFVINKEKSDKTYKKDQLNNSKTNSLKSELKNFKIEINSADTTEFKSLKGIGSYYAGKIVKYRKALGGFYSVDQLKEVYGIPEEAIEQNKSRLVIDDLIVEKININSCEAVGLKKHPYINWNIANSIVQIRKSHSLYKTVEEIKKSDLVNEEIYRKIAPYLKTE